VIDEQHRFGVKQRAALRQKGDIPHLLVMTATPIPRSMALTLYGDLDLTVIDEMPPNRQTIETHLLHQLERERAYQLIRSHAEEGHQAFIVYPLVESTDEENQDKAVVEEHKKLQEEVFKNYNVGLLHGRLKADEKESVMLGFRDQEYQVLASTSVIEVGVDIPNATVILIESANRFGLAQLHQFRGRVGRGEEKSFCLLIPDSDEDMENTRLKAMIETSDGFILAEKDLDIRGPGDFLGTRQSGFSELKVASLTNIKLIETAREEARRIMDLDPELQQAQHKAIQQQVSRFWRGGEGDIS
jgi:ATP-dependent DNA helicase RecG